MVTPRSTSVYPLPRQAFSISTPYAALKAAAVLESLDLRPRKAAVLPRGERVISAVEEEEDDDEAKRGYFSSQRSSESGAKPVACFTATRARAEL